MNIKIIGVGKVRIAEYAKRMERYAKFEIVEVPDEKAPETLSQAEMDAVMAKEGERILAKIKDREYVYALAIKGKERSSEEFAKEINQLATYGHSDITFVIGGSLGRFTLPHKLMRLVLAEQIYRAFTIINGLPYHK